MRGNQLEGDLMKMGKKFAGIASIALLAGMGVFTEQAQAAVVTYTIDPNQSSLFVSGMLTGNFASAQTQGSLSTSYSGTIVADVGGGTIKFPEGSHINAANQPTDQEPDSTDVPGSSAPANYGRTADGPFGSTSLEAIRGLSFDVSDDTSGAGITLNGTNFNSGSLVLLVDSGISDVVYGATGVQTDLSGKGTSNGTAGGFSSLVQNGTTETLTLKIDSGPIAYNVEQSADSNVSFSGTIVATRTVVPEPASVALCGLAGIGLLRRRRSKQS
jgi:hypothetical protein